MVFDGSGFLYNQCRHMVGCLLAIGRGKPIDIPGLLETGKSDHPGFALQSHCMPCLPLKDVKDPARLFEGLKTDGAWYTAHTQAVSSVDCVAWFRPMKTLKHAFTEVREVHFA